VIDGPESGINIHGLFMQGAKWDMRKESLEDSDPGIIIVQMPVIWLEPVLLQDLGSTDS
jgi:dynein heavy chain